MAFNIDRLFHIPSSTMDDRKATIIQAASTRGNPKMVYRGYVYVIEKKNSLKTHWRCELRRQKCLARCVEVSGFITKDGTESHNHNVNTHREMELKVQASIKRKALENSLPAKLLVRDEAARVSADHVVSESNIAALQRQVVRVRRKGYLASDTQTTLADLNLPIDWTSTLTGEKLMQYDSGIESAPEEGRIIILLTHDAMTKLAASDSWYITSPASSNLCCIHSHALGNLRPLAYVLMTRRSQASYEGLLTEIKGIFGDYGILAQPRLLVTDLETPLILACHRVFPSARVCANIQQLSWSIGRKLGTQLDCERKNIQRKLTDLASMTMEESIECWSRLEARFKDSESELIMWFSETFIHGKLKRWLKSGKPLFLPPQFPPKFWTGNKDLRYTVELHNWHSKWQNIMKMSLEELVPAIQREENQTSAEFLEQSELHDNNLLDHYDSQAHTPVSSPLSDECSWKQDLSPSIYENFSVDENSSSGDSFHVTPADMKPDITSGCGF